MANFVNRPWSTPETKLDAEDFCSVCLIDLNEPGKPKVKSKCKLPVKSSPDSPYNVNALRAAALALVGARGGVDAPPDAKRQAAKKLVRLFREANIPVFPSLAKIANER
jgi:hypothetical protein